MKKTLLFISFLIPLAVVVYLACQFVGLRRAANAAPELEPFVKGMQDASAVVRFANMYLDGPMADGPLEAGTIRGLYEKQTGKTFPAEVDFSLLPEGVCARVRLWGTHDLVCQTGPSESLPEAGWWLVALDGKKKPFLFIPKIEERPLAFSPKAEEKP